MARILGIIVSLFLAFPAYASSVTINFTTELHSIEFTHFRSYEMGNGPNTYQFQQGVQISANNTYGFSDPLVGLLGQGPQTGSITYDPDTPYGAKTTVTCVIGGINCSSTSTIHNNFKATPDHYQAHIFSYETVGIDLLITPTRNSLNLFFDQAKTWQENGWFYSAIAYEARFSLSVSGISQSNEQPYSVVPLPAGGLLLLSGLSALWIRRFRPIHRLH